MTKKYDAIIKCQGRNERTKVTLPPVRAFSRHGHRVSGHGRFGNHRALSVKLRLPRDHAVAWPVASTLRNLVHIIPIFPSKKVNWEMFMRMFMAAWYAKKKKKGNPTKSLVSGSGERRVHFPERSAEVKVIKAPIYLRTRLERAPWG